ncbi:uncharacterized protein LOC141695303 [Apium graveolens]|uniref:uncharacterized protein LOC141695303 n=1 Tax=Apium graveolens TaxID=4045 RepID=UPI003D78EDE1
MVKLTKIEAFFKRKNVEISRPQSRPQSVDQETNVHNSSNLNSASQAQPNKIARIDKSRNDDINLLKRDPGLRPPIWDSPIDKCDEIRRAYIKAGPYQIILLKYPRSKEKHPRNFQASWFKLFPTRLRLEVSITAAKYLAFQGSAFRGHDETNDSLNIGNFKEFLNVIASYSDKVAKVIANAPKNATYTSPRVQKEILHVFSTKVKKVLILRDFPYAYYVHCMAHRLQLALVASAKEVIPVHHFFTKLNNIINIVGSSCKRNDQLKAAHASNIAYFLANDELQSGKGNNHIGSLQRAGDTLSISLPDLSAQYIARKGRARHQEENFTIEHHYKVNIFLAVLDCQLQELNNRFNERTIELLVLGTALDPKEMQESIRIDDVLKLAQKFYPQDFAEFEMAQLRMQFEHFDHERQHQIFGTLSTISDLSQWLKKTRKADIYPLVHKLVALILTLSVSTATIERSFSAMSFVKNKLRNKIHDEYLTDCLILFLEKEIARTITINSIINDFRDLKERRSLF